MFSEKGDLSFNHRTDPYVFGAVYSIKQTAAPLNIGGMVLGVFEKSEEYIRVCMGRRYGTQPVKPIAPNETSPDTSNRRHVRDAKAKIVVTESQTKRLVALLEQIIDRHMIAGSTPAPSNLPERSRRAEAIKCRRAPWSSGPVSFDFPPFRLGPGLRSGRSYWLWFPYL